MFILSGKSICKGISIGQVVVWNKKDNQVLFKKNEDSEYEIQRVNRAVEVSRQQLQKIYEKAFRGVGEEKASIFKDHEMLLEDKGFLNSIYHVIQTEKATAEYAVEVVKNKYVSIFEKMTDEYMKTRGEDIKDISLRLLKNLEKCEDVIERDERIIDVRFLNIKGENEKVIDTDKFIVVADSLSPAEIVQMDKEKLLALVIVHGSTNSHTAILARTLNIPVLIGVSLEISKIVDGTKIIVDGFSGEVIFEPTEEICRVYESKIRLEEEKKEIFWGFKENDNHICDGKNLRICATIGSLNELDDVLANDADGIGLFRSEFLYLGKKDVPTEEEQFQVYKKILQTMKEKNVTIRTFDIGGDKQTDYFWFGEEENPALGYRGIRIYMKHPEIFKTQIRALLRAAVFGNLSVMYPMITSIEEVKWIYKIIEEVANELDNKKISYKIPQQGIMIETPAAAMISDELAEMVDFFSIGTNDLTQYTLVIDRQNEKLEDFYNPHHRALMKMIKMVVENGHKAGKRVGICGELAADLTLTEEFVCMGVEELSVVPSMVLKLRKLVRKI